MTSHRKTRRRSWVESLERRLQFDGTTGTEWAVTPGAATRPAAALDVSAGGAATLEAAALAAPLTISEGVHTFATLIDTPVTMSGKSELHVTGTSNPIAGSTINLTSADAWFWLDNVKPSVVNSTYLSQVRVNGAAAVHGSNVRVVQFGMGTVVIPHAPSYQPFVGYSGPNFTGTPRAFGQYTYNDTAGELGQLNRNISSFKLKRGYMATIATQTNGGGRSKVYVAQDHDLDVALLPAEFDNSVQFVRVFPWRWVSKKGASDLSPTTLNASWHYNWDNNQNSGLDSEYVPIKQQRWWPDYPTNKPDSTHLLGFNEPNNPVEDAYESLGNGSVDTAIAVWPELLASGLRVGSPAVTDGGKAWLYEFMDKAIAANLRVDYIAIHNYQAGHTATSLHNWLKDVYDRYHLPIWLTEFNNGANWTGGADPTYEQNAAAIGSFIDMMDNTPWIERYSIYSRVEAVRQMTYDAGGLTPAGQVYFDNVSPIGYVQEAVDGNPAGRGIAQLPLDGNTLDTSGHGNNGHVAGAPTYVAGQRGQALRLDGTPSSFVRLTENVASGNEFSFAAWVNWDGGGIWQRIFDFGNGTNAYAFLSPSSGTKMRFAIKNGGAEQIVEANTLPIGQWTHVAVTLGGGSARLYVNGALAGTNNAVTIRPGDFDPAANYLGKSQYAVDPLFRGRLDDVLIRDSVLTQAQIAALMNNAPPQFSSGAIAQGPARRGAAFSGTVAGSASDPNGDAVTYSKASGPAWLNVAADGTLSGTPGFAERIPQEFVVTASDSKGSLAYAVLTISLADHLAWYRADETAGSSLADASGHNQAATLSGAYAFTPGRIGSALQLSGGHASLPAGVVSGVTDFTIATWVKLDALSTWSRIFDFGTGTSVNMFLTPQAGGTNLPRFGITAAGGGGEQRIDSSTALATGTWAHVAVTLAGNTGTLYINGAAVGANNVITFTPAALGNTTQNYIGKSQYPDPALQGSVDDFRIYARALSLSELQALVAPLPAWLAAGSAATWNATTKALTVTGAATIIADPGSDAPVITANGPASVVTMNPSAGRAVHVGGLTLTGGATATLTSVTSTAAMAVPGSSLTTPAVRGGGSKANARQTAAITATAAAVRTVANSRVLVVNGDTFTIDATSTLDLADNNLLLNYSGASPAAGVEAMVKLGYNGGDWLGKRITSSATNADRNFALGVSDNSRLVIPFSTTRLFAGEAVDATAVLVKFTHRVDLDLDGVITTNDATIFNSNFSEGAAGRWGIGDVDFDGLFTTNDATIFNSYYDETLGAA